MPYRLSRVAVGAIFVALLAAALAACSQQPASPPPQPPAATVPIPTAPPAIATQPPATAEPTAVTAPTATATTVPTPVPAAATAPTPEPTAAQSTESSETAQGAAVFILDEGTVARYKVEEVLARQGFFVATGETSEVDGRIVFDADGNVVADESGIIVQAASLKTNSDRRDGYVRERTLLTAQYPEIVFRPTSVEGLPSPLSEASGEINFTISGDLTIRDQTRPVTWDATAEFGDSVTGLAIIDINFEQFGMDKPSVAIVVSVEDTIRLELDFVGSLEQPSAANTGDAEDEEASAAAQLDIADESYAQVLGDPNAPVMVVDFSDIQ